MNRVVASSEEIAATITVAIRRMPKTVWRDLERHWELSQQKRQGARPDIETAIAQAVAEHFERSRWEVSYPERGNLFADKGQGNR